MHGKEEADGAVEATRQLFSGETSELTPTYTLQDQNDILFVVVDAGLAGSNSEARRLLEQGGIKINQQKTTDVALKVKKNDLVQVGKRRFVKIV